MSKQKWIDMRGNKKKAVAVGAGVGAIGIMILAVAGVLPTIAGYLFLVMANVWWLFGVAFSAIAGWFLSASDESHERAIWAFILIVFVVLICWWAGVNILTSWILWVFVAFFAMIGVLAFAISRGKKTKK